MKILFIGGTGIISKGVSELAIRKGIELYHFNRGTSPELFVKGVKHIRGDINKFTEMKSILSNYRFDIVIDWLAFTPEDIERDLELFNGKVGHFIFISSASVYKKPVDNYLITETSPVGNKFWQYARNKIASEERILKAYSESNFPATIVRPSFTYGLTLIPAIVANNKKPMTLVNRIREGKKIIVPGDGNSLWVMTHNSDFAKGLLGLLGNSKAIGEIFHITSDEVLTWNKIIETIGEVIGSKPDIIHIPSDLINHYAPDIGAGLLGDKSNSVVFDNSKIKKFVPEFNCEVKYKEGISRSLEWIEKHPQYCSVDNENNKIMDEIIKNYERAFGI